MDAISVLERGITRAPHAETLDLLAVALQVTSEERAAWEQATRGLRLPSEEAAVSLNDLRLPLTPRTLPTGTVTLLFTDIENSTQLLQQLGLAYAQALGEDTWAAALAVGRTRTLEQAIAEALRETD